MEGRIGFGKRFGAFLIDIVVICIGGAILGSLLGGVIGAGAGVAAGVGDPDIDPELGAAAGGALGGIIGMVMGMVAGIGLMGVVFTIWEGLTGAALGKMLLKICIKSADGQNAPVGQLLGRAAVKNSNMLLGLLGTLTGLSLLTNLGGLAGFVIFVGFFFTLGASKQAIHDMILKTAVYNN